MLFHYVIRNLRKRPFLNLVKVIGLALGLSGILFITLFLKNEMSYDTFHSHSKQIYRFTVTDQGFFANNHFARIYSSQQVPDLAANFPEIDNYVRLAPIRGGVIMHDQRYYSINEAFECDSTFFMVFDAHLLVGDKNTVLETPGSMVVSEGFAHKVFGNTDPVGQIISIPAGQFYGQQSDFTIKGVMKDYPQNSHFHPEIVTTPTQGEISGWAFTYLLLSKNANPNNITTAYAQFIAKQSDRPVDEIKTQAHLQNITDIHLHSNKLREIEANGNMTNIYVLSIAAIILLLISMSNYASLNLGMAGFNSKFVAINRVLGSSRHMNLKYFAAECIFIIAASIFVALLISIPVNSFIDSFFGINLFNGNLGVIVSTIILFSLFGTLSGLQPVLKQSIAKIYRSDRNLIKTANIPVSRGIIITQYSLGIILISSVFVISRQTNFALTNSMGNKEDNIICFESVHANIQQKFEVFKAELLKHNTIESVSAMMEPPGGEANDMFGFELEGRQPANENEPDMVGVFPCDYSFANLFNLEFIGGNNFSEKNADAEGSGEYILNEAAMHLMACNDPDEIVGKNFKLNSPTPAVTLPAGKIVGVVKDFHLSSLKKKVDPLVFFKRDKLWLLNFVVSYKPGMKEAAVADIQSVWNELFPTYPFMFENVGAMYKKVYKTELLQARLLS
ncbi:MAG: ABC transporter permease, partial [Prolixibacteraceae bacterium]|nr:ABC transporter permease [Prolixibacteraceae bacterium]